MSKNGYFEEDDLSRFKPEFDDYNDLGGSDSNQLEDDYDAFNEDTFGNELGGECGEEDWEAEHDKLIMMEDMGKMDGEVGTKGSHDRTLTKVDDLDYEGNDNEYDEFKENTNEDDNYYDQTAKLKNKQQTILQTTNLNINNSSTHRKSDEGVNSLQKLQQEQQLLFLQQKQAQIQQQQQQQQSHLSNIQQQQQPSNQMFNEQQLKLLQQLQMQQQLQQQLKQQPQGQMNPNLLRALQMQQQQQQQMVLQQLQLYQQQQQQQQVNSNSSSSRNTPVQQLYQQHLQIQNNNTNNSNNKANAANLTNLFNNLQLSSNNIPNSQIEKEKLNNLIQSKLADLNKINQSNNLNSNAFNNNDSQSLNAALQKLLHQQQQQKQLNTPANLNPAMLNILQQQIQMQQQTSNKPTPTPQVAKQPEQLPKLPPVLQNVKTLEEIENELLNAQPSSSSRVQSSTLNSNQQAQPPVSKLTSKTEENQNTNLLNQLQHHQQQTQPNQQQMELLKLIGMINNNTNNNNNNTNSNNINTNESQQQQQKQLLFLQQQLLQQQQIQQAALLNAAAAAAAAATSGSNGVGNLNQLNKLNEQQLQLLQQQQLSRLGMNLNNLLPANFQYLSQQQKQLLLAQRNIMQASIIQQQIMQQQQSSSQPHTPQHMQHGLLDNSNNNRPQSRNDLLLDHLNNSSNNDSLTSFLNNSLNNTNKNEDSFNNDSLNMNNSGNNFNNNSNNNNNRNKNRNRRVSKHPYFLESLQNKNLDPANDKLAGMMTDKEKNWVVNVQMLQLQIDDPYCYDYYYTTWMAKKKQFSSQNSNSAALKTSVLFQSNNKHDQRNNRQLTFENSLGKVTMSNFNHPRALIDINARSNDQNHSNNSGILPHIDGLDEEDEENKKEAKNVSTILLEIEKMYQVHLNIEEVEHNILKEPDETRAPLFQDRRSKVDKLASMMCSENFAHYLFVPKGKRLLGKCLPTFNINQTKLILGYFMQYIYIISKNNISLDEIYSQISYAIDTLKFSDLIDIVNQFVHLYSRQTSQIYHTIFSNKFGLSYLLKYVSKSELINQDDYENDVKQIWSSYLNLVLNGLTTIQPGLLDQNNIPQWNIIEISPLNLNSLRKNFIISPELWNKNEKKLTELFSIVDNDNN